MAVEVIRLRISEIFFSLQGETRTVGLPTTFVRLTGCPLRCHYCDTSYAFSGGDWMTLDEVVSQVEGNSAKHVTVTGGEPLAQLNCIPLLTALCQLGYEVSLETSGAIDIAAVDKRVVKVMDLKTPASGESDKNLWSNLDYLSTNDQIKFVICNESDYEWCKARILEHKLEQLCEVLLSPSQDELSPALLADWILRDQLNVRFQLQLHKVLWGDEAGR
ncbi:MAG: 7-carboxy-7-deazaguanine synthase QueE [Gammaproteobacteria bacterium]|nr:7-carboxy-7-deazaguanine synthase QueE [Gammaproteobacteria bacterium]